MKLKCVSISTLLSVLDDLKVNLLFEYFPNDKNSWKMFEITTLWSKIIDSWYLSISYIILWQTRSYWHWHIFWIEGRSRGQPSWLYYAMIVQQGKKFEIFFRKLPSTKHLFIEKTIEFMELMALKLFFDEIWQIFREYWLLPFFSFQ